MSKTILSFFLICFAIIPAFAIDQDDNPNSQSPYFIVKSKEGYTVQLPLKHTEAKVNITGVIADVVVKQVYENKSEVPIDAEYVFPGSTRSAVYGMKMKVGNREIVAKVKEKKQAQKEYNEAVSEGKRASLLQQHRPNVFQMNVGNIGPGETIEVELKYTELIVPEDGVYEFVYPRVVGPRYADSTGVLKDSWVLNPHTNPDIYDATFSQPTFDINANIFSGIPIKEAVCTSHPVDVNYNSSKEAAFKLKSPGVMTTDADYILRYRLAGSQIESGISLYEGEDENFFLMMVEPPKKVKIEEIPPREYIFIVDVSGSMNGFPIGVSKDLMRNLLGELRPEDRFNVMLFASTSALFSESSVSASKVNISKALNFIDQQNGSGSTNLLSALERALKLKGTEDYSRTFVIATDGFVTVEKEAFDLIRSNLGEANFFPFGIGGNVNRYIIEGIAHAGQSEPLIVLTNSEAAAKAEKFRQYISTPVLTNIEINYPGFEVYDIEPKSYPDVFAKRPIIVYGKYKKAPQGKVTITGTSGNGTFNKELDLKKATIAKRGEALKYLWARNKIKTLSDYNKVSRGDGLKTQIINLGLKYNLLTEYTSFVAIDHVIDQVAKNKKVVAPGYATPTNYNSAPGSVPEPHEWALIIVCALTAAFMFLKKK